MTKIELLMMDCYRELFANSNPKGDFDQLVENATINDRGQKEIPFMDYEIEPDKMDEIIAKYQRKIRRVGEKQAFKTAILLGCSPKSKI